MQIAEHQPVFHGKFGEGTVLALTDTIATVQFPSAGLKRVALSFLHTDAATAAAASADRRSHAEAVPSHRQLPGLPKIKATPFQWRDPKSIPPRRWLYGEQFVRRFTSTTMAPGGVGKSSLLLIEALAMVTGRPLLGIRPPAPLRVWYWNGEDPLEETERRIAAACLHFRIAPEEVDGLFIDSGRTTEIVIAEQTRAGFSITCPVADALTETIRKNRIDVSILDPFVSTHRVTENDNNAIDAVAKQFGKIADSTDSAIELVHHVRKTGGAKVTVEDGRGAGALLAAVRSARVLNAMTGDEAAKAGVKTPRRFFSVENGKANMAPPPEKADWYQLVSVALGNGDGGLLNNGDHVAVVTPWTFPDAMDGIGGSEVERAFAAISAGRWRRNIQSTDWVGIPVADALGLDLTDPRHKAKVAAVLKTWLSSKALRVVTALDEKRKKREFVEVADLGHAGSTVPDGGNDADE